jgi:Zn-dependent protease
LGAVGLLIWKMKFLVGFFALKLPTLLTFAASLAVYWAAWGWQFALGFLLCMYVHELGHVAAARKYGLPVSAPMFVPGFGAFIRLRAHPRTASENAWIGLAGPLAGMAATAVCAGLAFVTGSKLLAAVASGSALLNLFNLVPIWQLDGARAFHGFTRAQQVMATLSLVGAWLITNDGLVGVIAIVAIGRSLTFPVRKDASDWRAAAAFIASAVGLAALAWVTTPLAK